MKKVIAIILCIAMMVPVALISSNALTKDYLDSGLDMISANDVYSCSWSATDKQAEVFLKVSATGFYDLYAEDNYGDNCYVEFDIYDASKEDSEDRYSYYDGGYFCLDEESSKEFNNIYLIKNKLYKVVLSSSYWDWDYEETVYVGGNISFEFCKNSFSPVTITSSYKQVSLASTKTNIFKVKTTKAGDYELTFNTNTNFGSEYLYVDLYDTSNMKEAQYYYGGSSVKSVRFNLSANKTYIMVISSPESTKIVKAKFAKCSTDIKKIAIAKQPKIYQDTYFYSSDFSYTVTYSDGSKKTLSAEKLNFSYYIYYAGKYYKGHNREYDTFYYTGKQPVEIRCFPTGSGYKKIFKSNVKITAVYDIVKKDSVCNETTDCYVPNDGSKDWQYRYYKVKVGDSTLYELYSYDWDYVGDTNADFFTSDGKLVEYKNGGWPLTAGKEYCLRFEVEFADDYDDDFHFTVEALREHTTHTYKKVTTPATMTANGKIQSKCTVCDRVNESVKTTYIYKIETVKLSGTYFTYTGKTITPSVTVKDSKGNTLKKNTDYTVTYSSGRKNIGTYNVTVKFKGNYSGTKTLTFKIVPGQVQNLKSTKQTKSAISLKWSKATGAKYYLVEKSTNGKTWSRVSIVSGTTLTVSSLKSGTKYQFRVKALDSSKNYAGKASDTLKVSTK